LPLMLFLALDPSFSAFLQLLGFFGVKFGRPEA